MTIAYILGTFPSGSEYFILSEMKELKKNGFNILILALNKGSIPGNDACNLDNEAIYDRHIFSPVKWYAHLYALLSIKRNYFHVVKMEVINKKASFFNNIRALKRFSTAVYFFYRLRKTPVGQLHAHFISTPTDIAILLSKLAGIRFSCSAHANDIYTSSKEDLLKKIGKAAYVVTCTEFNADYLRNIANDNKAGCIYQIYHGIDLAAWSKRTMPVKSAGNNTICILTVARLVEKKGIIYLLEAVDMLKRQGHSIECFVIGDGPLSGYYKNYIDDHHLQETVHLLGALPQKEVKTFYKKADIFVLPCINAKDGDKDGLPNVLVEALAVGVPVISTGVSAIPELIAQDVTGLLVPERDPVCIAKAVLRLKNDPALYHSIVQKGWEVVTRFNIDNSTAQLVKLFASK